MGLYAFFFSSFIWLAHCATKLHIGRPKPAGQSVIMKSDQTSTSGSQSRRLSKSLSWYVQLSDLHIAITHGAHGEERYRDYMDLLSKHVLRALQPAAIILTGDLVEGKNRQGTGQQHAEEWQMLDRFLSRISEDSGLPLERILSVRGNHDTFNTPVRGGPGDFYSALRGDKFGSARVQIDSLPSKLTWAADSGRWSVPAENATEDAAILLGFDWTPNTGFRAIANFAGVLTPQLEREITGKLQETAVKAIGSRAVSALRGTRTGLPILGYGHYPLSVVHRQPGCVHKGPVSDLLLSGGVSAYLCGHLHNAFGNRQHRLHRGPPGSDLALLEIESSAAKDSKRIRFVTVDDGRIGFTDLHLQRQCKRRPPSLSAPHPPLDALKAAGVQLRFENATCCSFIDGAAPTWGTGGAAEGPQMLVAITSPADARHGPTTAAARVDALAELRALVLPLALQSCWAQGEQDRASEAVLTESERQALYARTRVQVHWACVPAAVAALPRQDAEPATASKSGRLDLTRAAPDSPLYSAPWPHALACDEARGEALILQARATLLAASTSKTGATAGSAGNAGALVYTTAWRPVDPPRDLQRFSSDAAAAAQNAVPTAAAAASFLQRQLHLPRHFSKLQHVALYAALRLTAGILPAARKALGCSPDVAPLKNLDCHATFWEYVVLRTDWGTFAEHFFWTGWTVAVAFMLILPRLLAASAAPRSPAPAPPAPAPSAPATPVKSGGGAAARVRSRPPPSPAPSPAPASALNTTPTSFRATAASLRSCKVPALLLWPFATLQRSARYSLSTAVQLIYLVNLAYGPVGKGRFLTSNPAVWVSTRGFRWRAPDGTWSHHASPDVLMFIFCTHTWFVVLPLLFAVADYQANVLAARVQAAILAGKLRPPPSLARSLAALRAAFLFSFALTCHLFLLKRGRMALGWEFVLLSPGIGWTLPCFGLALGLAHWEARRSLKVYFGGGGAGGKPMPVGASNSNSNSPVPAAVGRSVAVPVPRPAVKLDAAAAAKEVPKQAPDSSASESESEDASGRATTGTTSVSTLLTSLTNRSRGALTASLKKEGGGVNAAEGNGQEVGSVEEDSDSGTGSDRDASVDPDSNSAASGPAENSNGNSSPRQAIRGRSSKACS